MNGAQREATMETRPDKLESRMKNVVNGKSQKKKKKGCWLVLTRLATAWKGLWKQTSFCISSTKSKNKSNVIFKTWKIKSCTSVKCSTYSDKSTEIILERKYAIKYYFFYSINRFMSNM